MRVIALVQARLGSVRLPGKMLLRLHGLPIIDWVTRRAAAASLLDGLVVATGDQPRDDRLAEHLTHQGIAVFRGPEEDVLERFRLAGEWAKASHVVRICADNPLIWGGAIDALILQYRQIAESADEERLYVYNHIPRDNLWPDGLGAEMVSFPLLASLAQRAVRPEHREHCLSYIWEHAAEFAVRTFDPDSALLRRPKIRLDVDTPADYRRLALMPLNPASSPEEALRLYIQD
ncbi:MAG: NTP transferase domain-containing protein [Deltaproteobacteria bacterium]|jgi:spore coat polysaccharide biosynthesis protein SpsF|nr:NTP transferase domain-containing protein [Deltaproteobacteria bacterium]